MCANSYHAMGPQEVTGQSWATVLQTEASEGHLPHDT